MIRIRIVAKTLQAVPVILALALSGCFEDSVTPPEQSVPVTTEPPPETSPVNPGEPIIDPVSEHWSEKGEQALDGKSCSTWWMAPGVNAETFFTSLKAHVSEMWPQAGFQSDGTASARYKITVGKNAFGEQRTAQIQVTHDGAARIDWIATVSADDQISATSVLKTEAGQVFGLTAAAASGASSPSFPETAITDKASTSVYAISPKNPFSGGDLPGNCTWYAYGRVIELADKGYLPSAAALRIKSALGNAARWPSQIGGTWDPPFPIDPNVTTPLPISKRKKGLLAVYPGPFAEGHVGFVEEISTDKKRFRMSEFNRRATKLYTDRWYYFDPAEREQNDALPDASLGTKPGEPRYYPSFCDISNP